MGRAPGHDVWVTTDLERARVKNDVLRTYLTTHLKVGAALLQRVARMLEDAEEPLVSLLPGLQGDVEAEQVWLVNLIMTMQLPTTTLWRSSTLTADTIRTLILVRRQSVGTLRSPALDIETLTCVVQARLLLWQTLSDVADVLPLDREHLVIFHNNARRHLHALSTAHELPGRHGFVA